MMLFYVDDNTEGKAVCRCSPDLFLKGAGSFNVIAARVLGMTFPDYLRFVREKYSATLQGREGYTCYYFKNRQDCARLVNDLNRIWRNIEKEALVILEGEKNN